MTQIHTIDLTKKFLFPYEVECALDLTVAQLKSLVRTKALTPKLMKGKLTFKTSAVLRYQKEVIAPRTKEHKKKELIDIQEVYLLLRCSYKNVARLIASGALTPYQTEDVKTGQLHQRKKVFSRREVIKCERHLTQSSKPYQRFEMEMRALPETLTLAQTATLINLTTTDVIEKIEEKSLIGFKSPTDPAESYLIEKESVATYGARHFDSKALAHCYIIKDLKAVKGSTITRKEAATLTGKSHLDICDFITAGKLTIIPTKTAKRTLILKSELIKLLIGRENKRKENHDKKWRQKRHDQEDMKEGLLRKHHAQQESRTAIKEGIADRERKRLEESRLRKIAKEEKAKERREIRLEEERLRKIAKKKAAKKRLAARKKARLEKERLKELSRHAKDLARAKDLEEVEASYQADAANARGRYLQRLKELNESPRREKIKRRYYE